MRHEQTNCWLLIFVAADVDVVVDVIVVVGAAAGVAAVAAFQLRKLVESLVVVGFIVFGILVKRLILPADKLVTLFLVT